MKAYYECSSEEVLSSVNSSRTGLSSKEAASRLQEHGPNSLKEPPKATTWQRFLAQLKDPMLLILLAAAGVSAATSLMKGDGMADVFIILIVVLLNAILGVLQESKAEAAIEALQTMTAAVSKVLRDDQQISLHSSELVPGDIVLLEAGDSIPADGRILEAASLKIEEAALTGESVPVTKTEKALSADASGSISLGDRKNMAYMGSTVVYGRGRMVITETGMKTEMGRIAGALSQTKEEQTPLQRRLDELGRILSRLVLGICIFIFGFNLISAGRFDLDTVLSTFMTAISLAVAAIPEGLATVVTVVLSIGVTNMSKRNAVIRRLTAVETLGCAQVICSDKTGTLTQNKMTVTDFIGDQSLLAKAMALCNDASLNQDGNVSGEPTEAALVSWAASLGLRKPQLEQQLPRVEEAPFDSVRKMMSTVHSILTHSDSKDPDFRHSDPELSNSEFSDQTPFIQFTKGAPDEILSRCTTWLSYGKELPMTQQKREEILAQNKGMADRALRVLAGACRCYDRLPSDLSPESLEQNLCFLGLTGMIDPVRPEVKAAIQECREAGIRPVMITGDHRDTAIAIASELGIISSPDQAITGAQLNQISDNELAQTIDHYGVYARVQPEHKVRIVNAWKKKGYITAMTGDGVNDAPSIKAADIGIGMGITGTDVTKNVADMVLADDNFATIVNAVGEGRRIYDNIRKAIQFLLASNLSEVLGVFFSTLLGFTLLKPVHLLFINLITDCFPALALGLEKAEPGSMKRPPRKSTDGIFAGGLGFDLIYQGLLITVITLLSYLVGHRIEAGIWEIPKGVSPNGMTMAFLTMSMCEIFHSFNMRSQRKSIFSLRSQNLVLWGAMLGSLALTALILEVPVISALFGFTPVSPLEYLIAVSLAFLVIPIVELVKLIQRKLQR